jgi:hypothetical protein
MNGSRLRNWSTNRAPKNSWPNAGSNDPTSLPLLPGVEVKPVETVSRASNRHSERPFRFFLFDFHSQFLERIRRGFSARLQKVFRQANRGTRLTRTAGGDVRAADPAVQPLLSLEAAGHRMRSRLEQILKR